MRTLQFLTLAVITLSLASCSGSPTPDNVPPKDDPDKSNTTNDSADDSNDTDDSSSSDIDSLPDLGDYVLKVESYYGTYDVSQKELGTACKSLDGPHPEDWPEAPKPAKPYHIGVLFPHFKDPYWLAVNYGIIAEARRVGVSITLLDAGGYGNLGDQRKQLTSDAANLKVDGVILASIDYEKLDTAVDEVVGKGIPVVEVINDIRAASITAKALVSFFDMGTEAGKFVVQDAGDKDVKVAFLPGPEGAGWAEDTLLGFRAAVDEKPETAGNVEILPELYGKTEAPVQRSRIKSVLDRNENVDYIVGNAVAADVATDMVEQYKEKHPNLKIVGTYIIPAVYDKIEAGLIAAAPSDLTVDQGRMSVDMMVRLLNGDKPGDQENGFPFRSGPVLQVITKETIEQFSYERLFGPRDFKSILKFEPK